jgi:hypothetical protein
MSQAVEKIERRIEAIESVPAGSLLRPRVTREDVTRYLDEHPGSRAGGIAHALGVGQPAISAHLHRGRDRLFGNRGGSWFVGERPAEAAAA